MAFDFGKLVDKFKDKANELADASASAARKVADKGADLAKTAKLNTEMAAERDNLKKAYQLIGEKYFEKYGTDADPDFAEAITAARAAFDAIEEKKIALEALKTAAGETAEEVEVEVVEESEEACDAAEEKVEEVKEALDKE